MMYAWAALFGSDHPLALQYEQFLTELDAHEEHYEGMFQTHPERVVHILVVLSSATIRPAC